MRQLVRILLFATILFSESHAYTLSGDSVVENNSAAKSNAEKANEILDVYRTSLSIFWLDVKRFPTTNEGLTILKQDENIKNYPSGYIKGGYLKKIKPDPWGNPYNYENNGKEIKVWFTSNSKKKHEQELDNKFIIDIKVFEEHYGKY